MKRLIMAVTAVFAASSVFTACSRSGSDPDADTDVSQQAETQVSVTEVTEELVEPDYPVLTADKNSITFNDGDDLYTAHCMNTENYTDGEAECRLSVAEYKGERQLRIEVLTKNENEYGIPKIVFDMDKLVGSENLSKVKSFSVDMTQVAVGEFIGDEGEPLMVPGNLMGCWGSIVGENCDKWYEPTGSSNNFLVSEWNFEWVYYHCQGKWLIKGFTDGTTDSTLVFLRWAIPNQADVYLDNLTFYDADGNSIPIVYQPGEDEESVPESEDTVQKTEETEESGEIS